MNPTVLHIDLNSCFASIEQQANPSLRGRPVVVGAYTTGNGFILAASREAKAAGVKTLMNVREARFRCPSLVVLPPDPEKYRFVNKALKNLLLTYTPNLSVESIDEMVMDLINTPAISRKPMIDIAREIKARIRAEIGEWLTFSIGIAPNRYLAKVASGLHKPDGLDVITMDNIEQIFSTLELVDLCGIKAGISRRLIVAGIPTPVALLHASAPQLIAALHSITGYYWWLRLHGREDGVMYKQFDQAESEQKSFGQSHAMGKPKTPSDVGTHQVVAQLIMKMGRRLRRDGFAAKGFCVSCFYRDHTFWRDGHKGKYLLYDDRDFYELAMRFLAKAPEKLIHIVAIWSFSLEQKGYGQLSLFPEEQRKRNIVDAIDQIADRWGPFTVTPGRMLNMEQKVLDRIAFGGGRELMKAA